MILVGDSWVFEFLPHIYYVLEWNLTLVSWNVKQATSWKLDEALQLFYVGNEGGPVASVSHSPPADNANTLAEENTGWVGMCFNFDAFCHQIHWFNLFLYLCNILNNLIQCIERPWKWKCWTRWWGGSAASFTCCEGYSLWWFNVL